MGVADVPLLAALKSKMSFLNARNKVLTENIANADTPNYAARDISAPDFGAVLGDATGAVRAGKSAMRVSDARHMAPASVRGGYDVEEAPDAGGSVSGNRVSLESQIMKVAETQTDYQTASSLYKKSLNMLRLAISGAQSGG
ncbi:MAG: flagellar basal body rod protein FlgB [Pseudomonadota bacterium]